MNYYKKSVQSGIINIIREGNKQWVAIADKNDQYAKEASQQYTGLILKKERLITSVLKKEVGKLRS